ncbi:MAG: hypothetical protein J7K72_02365 [Candidatus Aenigmarchaeota archaeon]|nr:hypothetical protein [Candidatus Aenigmarchaeota archaeon]
MAIYPTFERRAREIKEAEKRHAHEGLYSLKIVEKLLNKLLTNPDNHFNISAAHIRKITTIVKNRETILKNYLDFEGIKAVCEYYQEKGRIYYHNESDIKKTLEEIISKL